MPLETNDPTERIAVLRTDLEQWLHTLRWAHGHSLSLDLAQNYREGRPDKTQSRLTRLTAQSHNRIEGYLEPEDSDAALSKQ